MSTTGRYRLIAKLDGNIETKTFTAHWTGGPFPDSLDGEAMMDAIKIILDKAHAEPEGPWSKGFIELRTAPPRGAGRLVQTMGSRAAV